MSGEPSIRLIIELLRQTTSLKVISEFLKSKGVPHSVVGWEELYSRRIEPAISSGAISKSDLVTLLRSVEETGRQHVFLYRTKTSAQAQELMARDRIKKALRKKGIEDLLDAPKVLDQPKSPTIADVRWDAASVDLRMIVKSIEQRVYQRYIGEKQEGNMLLKQYERVHERAVNIVRLHRDGLLELRIASHSNTNKYERDVRAFWGQIADLFSEADFVPISLQKAKNKLWNQREEFRDLVRFSDSTLRNDFGYVLRAATGDSDSNLAEDEGVVSSLDEFMKHKAYCDGSNVWFVAKESGSPSTDVHVRLSGEVNEFAVTAYCKPTDYEYVLAQLRTLNS